MTEESWEETHSVEETCRQTVGAESREILDEELQQGRRVQSHVQLQQRPLCLAGVRKEQQRTKTALTVRDYRAGKVRN